VIVGTCNTFISFPFCPTQLKGTSPTFEIGCGVPSPVETTPGFISFSRYENHSLRRVMWFDAPESKHHTAFELGAFCFTEFASCLVTKAD
jgi:hypothetical protein